MICLGCHSFGFQGSSVSHVADRFRVLGLTSEIGLRYGRTLTWSECAEAEATLSGLPLPEGGWVERAQELLIGAPAPRVSALSHGHREQLLVDQAVALLEECGGVLRDTCQRFLSYLLYVHQDGRSYTHPMLPRLAFLGRRAATHIDGKPRVVAAAETLFHEALHSKLLDVLLVRPLLSTPCETLIYEPSWPGDRPDGRGWHVVRVLAAAHVYTHLVHFYDDPVVRRQAEEERLDWTLRRATCSARAEELLRFLASQRVREHVREHGNDLVGSLIKSLEEGAISSCGECDRPLPIVRLSFSAQSRVANCEELGVQLRGTSSGEGGTWSFFQEIAQ